MYRLGSDESTDNATGSAACGLASDGTSRASFTGLFNRKLSVAFVPSTAVTLRVSSTSFSGSPV